MTTRQSVRDMMPEPGNQVTMQIPGVTRRNLQIAVAQCVPKDAKVFTERNGDSVEVYRWK